MFIDKEEKLEIKATGSRRICFIKKYLNLKNIKLNEVFYIEWYVLKTTQLRRNKIKVKCDDCKKIIEKRICDLDVNNDYHLCRNCVLKGDRNPWYGKTMHENVKKGLKKWTEENGNPFTWKSSKEKIKEKNGWKITADKKKGTHYSTDWCNNISKGLKRAWKEGKFTPHYDDWLNVKTEIYKGIEYQCSYELDFLKYIEKMGFLKDVERGPKIRYINKDNEQKIYFCDYRFKNSDIIFEIKSSYFLQLHKENYLLKEEAAKKKYDYNLVLDNDFTIVDEKIKQYNEIYKF